MFENETKAIFKKYVRSKIFLKKLKNLIGPYDYRGIYYNSVFRVVVPSIAHFGDIEQEAHNELEYLLKRHNLQRYNGKYQAYSNNITVKEHIRAINKISIDTKDKRQDSTPSIQNSELQKDTIKDTKVNSLDGIFSTFCPECGGKLIHSGGCTECIDCGWTKCE